MDANNVTADTFSHTSNTQRENTNAIFTSENLDKLNELEDGLKDFTVYNTEYYLSKSTIMNDAKCDLASNPKTVNQTSEEKGKGTDTSNGNLKQKLLSNRTLPVVVLTMNPRIDYNIVPIGGSYKMLCL